MKSITACTCTRSSGAVGAVPEVLGWAGSISRRILSAGEVEEVPSPSIGAVVGSSGAETTVPIASAACWSRVWVWVRVRVRIGVGIWVRIRVGAWSWSSAVLEDSVPSPPIGAEVREVLADTCLPIEVGDVGAVKRRVGCRSGGVPDTCTGGGVPSPTVDAAASILVGNALSAIEVESLSANNGIAGWVVGVVVGAVLRFASVSRPVKPIPVSTSIRIGVGEAGRSTPIEVHLAIVLSAALRVSTVVVVTSVVVSVITSPVSAVGWSETKVVVIRIGIIVEGVLAVVTVGSVLLRPTVEVVLTLAEVVASLIKTVIVKILTESILSVSVGGELPSRWELRATEGSTGIEVSRRNWRWCLEALWPALADGTSEGRIIKAAALCKCYRQHNC